jgi:hypothetical protein
MISVIDWKAMSRSLLTGVSMNTPSGVARHNSLKRGIIFSSRARPTIIKLISEFLKK